ncbi:hypothetical protein LTR84_012623 [Exophiala bonariae]|uniref:TLC domain-containing protein n=1 Tax=Exophiala bonariae TaxID=1690606 RepID=A0AAV9NEW8_9EURO|nr:hypothetical protein LTR84_012623 [Exophiala bonariae]
MDSTLSTTLAGFQQAVTTFCTNNNLATLPQHAHQVLTCFLVYEGLFLIVSPLLSERLLPNIYGRFPKRTKLNWDSRVVSFVQATFVSYKALQVIIGDGVRHGENATTEAARSSMTRDDRLWGYSPSTGDIQAYAAGYFLWDVLLCVRYLDIQGISALLHAVSALIITVMGFRPFANFYGINFILYELSTPFLNIHWALDKAGQTGSTLQLINGICLVLSFFGCRLLWGNYQTMNLSLDAWSAWKASNDAQCLGLESSSGPKGSALPLCKKDFPVNLLLVYLVGNTVLSALNVYWFSLMLKALRKRFSPASTGVSQSSKRGKKE